jgi:hypothetical protein
MALARQVHERWPRIGVIKVSGRATPQPGELPPGYLFHRKPYDEAIVLRHAHELTAAERSSAQPVASLQTWRG